MIIIGNTYVPLMIQMEMKLQYLEKKGELKLQAGLQYLHLLPFVWNEVTEI